MAIRRGFQTKLAKLSERKLKQLARGARLPALGIGSLLPAETREGRRPSGSLGT